MISLKVGGIIVAAIIAGAFVASPELRAYAANTVYSTDIVDGQVKNPDLAGNAVTYSKIAPASIDGSKIVDQSIASVDIGPDAVGASELKGVSRLIFGGPCTITFLAKSGGLGSLDCRAPGAKIGEYVVRTILSNSVCWGPSLFCLTPVVF